MKESLNRIYPLILLAAMLGGCKYIKQTTDKFTPLLPKLDTQQKTVTRKKQVSISCGKGNIETYTKMGWKIISKESKEITCSWKSKKSKPGCNLNLDKGCRITVPDKVGQQVIYSLEKKKVLSKSDLRK